MIKKKLSLQELKVKSFVTNLKDDSASLKIVGGQYTDPEPGSGPCVECIVTDWNYTGADCNCAAPSGALCTGGGDPNCNTMTLQCASGYDWC